LFSRGVEPKIGDQRKWGAAGKRKALAERGRARGRPRYRGRVTRIEQNGGKIRCGGAFVRSVAL